MDEELLDVVDEKELDGEAELFEALEALRTGETDPEEDEELNEVEDDEEEPADEDEEEVEDEEEEEKPVVEEKPSKKQSKEDNAKFAAKRRQEELDKKVQEELDRLKTESPEFKLAKQLSEMYGVPADQLVEQMKEAALKKEAQERNLPIELLRERQAERDRLQSVENELNALRYQQWQGRIESESQTLQTKYPMLEQADMDAAVDYILHTAKNVDLPLEQAVYALHGQKIIESMTTAKVQDKLATDSGRKKRTPLAPNKGTTASSAKSLTAEEKAIAKAFGMSDADYHKYKA